MTKLSAVFFFLHLKQSLGGLHTFIIDCWSDFCGFAAQELPESGIVLHAIQHDAEKPE